MNTGDAGQAVPLVTPTFSPSGHPELALFNSLVGADFAGTTLDACQVAALEGSAGHITLFSSHLKTSGGGPPYKQSRVVESTNNLL
jgi:hypothetical protein